MMPVVCLIYLLRFNVVAIAFINISVSVQRLKINMSVMNP